LLLFALNLTECGIGVVSSTLAMRIEQSKTLCLTTQGAQTQQRWLFRATTSALFVWHRERP